MRVSDDNTATWNVTYVKVRDDSMTTTFDTAGSPMGIDASRKIKQSCRVWHIGRDSEAREQFSAKRRFKPLFIHLHRGERVWILKQHQQGKEDNREARTDEVQERERRVGGPSLEETHDELELVFGHFDGRCDVLSLPVSFAMGGRRGGCTSRLRAGSLAASLLVVLVQPGFVPLVHVVSVAACEAVDDGFFDCVGESQVEDVVLELSAGVELCTVCGDAARVWDWDRICGGRAGSLLVGLLWAASEHAQSGCGQRSL